MLHRHFWKNGFLNHLVSHTLCFEWGILLILCGTWCPFRSCEKESCSQSCSCDLAAKSSSWHCPQGCPHGPHSPFLAAPEHPNKCAHTPSPAPFWQQTWQWCWPKKGSLLGGAWPGQVCSAGDIHQDCPQLFISILCSLTSHWLMAPQQIWKNAKMSCFHHWQGCPGMKLPE